ncbi:MAG: hypothetical protein ACJAYZ_001203 [Bacteroidia bacterium]|jgi:hypothetical protein
MKIFCLIVLLICTICSHAQKPTLFNLKNKAIVTVQAKDSQNLYFTTFDNLWNSEIFRIPKGLASYFPVRPDDSIKITRPYSFATIASTVYFLDKNESEETWLYSLKNSSITRLVNLTDTVSKFGSVGFSLVPSLSYNNKILLHRRAASIHSIDLEDNSIELINSEFDDFLYSEFLSINFKTDSGVYLPIWSSKDRIEYYFTDFSTEGTFLLHDQHPFLENKKILWMESKKVGVTGLDKSIYLYDLDNKSSKQILEKIDNQKIVNIQTIRQFNGQTFCWANTDPTNFTLESYIIIFENDTIKRILDDATYLNKRQVIRSRGGFTKNGLLYPSHKGDDSAIFGFIPSDLSPIQNQDLETKNSRFSHHMNNITEYDGVVSFYMDSELFLTDGLETIKVEMNIDSFRYQNSLHPFNSNMMFFDNKLFFSGDNPYNKENRYDLGFLDLEETKLLSSLAPNISEITLYPNPTSDKLHINSSINIQDLRVYSSQGRECRLANMPTLEVIDMSTLVRGIYYIEIYLSDQSRIIKKVIKD